MEYLINYFDKAEVIELLNMNPDIETLEKETANFFFETLKGLGYGEEKIKNIVLANPFSITKDSDDLKNLIESLKSLDRDYLHYIFYDNPWLLNKDAFEVEAFLKEKQAIGWDIEDIVEYIFMNPEF